MKNFLSALVALALLALALPALAADDYSVTSPYKLLFSSDNLTGKLFVNTNATASMTNTFQFTGKELCFEANIQAIAACDSNLVVTVYKSVSGTKWDAWTSFVPVASGTSVVTFVTNFTSVSWPWIKVVVSGGGTAAKAFTNTTVSVFTK